MWRASVGISRSDTPGASGSTSIALIPRCLGASRSVRTYIRIVVSGRPAPVHHIFWPFTTKWSPRSSAVVRSAAASEPASGSLIATA